MYFVSHNQLKPILTYFRNRLAPNDLFSFLSGIFATLYKYKSYEKIAGIATGLGGRHTYFSYAFSFVGS